MQTWGMVYRPDDLDVMAVFPHVQKLGAYYQGWGTFHYLTTYGQRSAVWVIKVNMDIGGWAP